MLSKVLQVIEPNLIDIILSISLGSISVLFEPELRLVWLVYVTKAMVTVDEVS